MKKYFLFATFLVCGLFVTANGIVPNRKSPPTTKETFIQEDPHSGKHSKALPGLDNYTIQLNVKGAIIGKLIDNSTEKTEKLCLIKDTSKIFRIDKKGYLRLKKGVTLLASNPVYRYSVTLGIGSTPFQVELVKDEFIHNKVIAHRGAWKNHAVSENSISSLKNTISLGCEGSEFDVWMAADSGLVISHDPVIGGKKIEQTTTAELQKIQLKQNDFVPTLSEYLDVIKSQNKTRLFLEIKESVISQERSLALTEKVVRMVHDHNAQAWVDYISFNYAVLQRILEMDPSANTAYLTGDKKVEELKAANIRGLDYPYRYFHSDKTITSDAHRMGLGVNVWTVDNKEEMKFLLKEGADQITTNEPEMLLELIREK